MKHLYKSLTSSSLWCNKELTTGNVISTSLFQKLKLNTCVFFFLFYSAFSWGLDSAKYNLTSDTSTLVAFSTGTKIGLPNPTCPTFASVITIGGSTVPGSSYATLTEAIADLSLCGITQPVILELSSTYTSASETFPLVLPSITGATATNTITIRPANGATGRSITSTDPYTTIEINGGNYWIIDGRKGGSGTVDLAITNTNPYDAIDPFINFTVSSAIRFINDASNNTIKYCNVASQAASSTSGVIVFSTTTGTTGNDNNTIDNCNLDGVEMASNIIYAAGTTSIAKNNSGNTISNCKIYRFNCVYSNSWNGVFLASGNTDWNIIGNSFLSASLILMLPNTLNFTAIRINNTSGNNFVITDNIIGGPGGDWGQVQIDGTNNNIVFRAIWLNVGSTTASSIQNNTIKNIVIETGTTDTRQCLIYLQGGSINCGTITGNTINNISYTLSTTTTTATNIASSTNTFSVIWAGAALIVNISNNSIGGIIGSNNSTGNINLRGIHTQGPNTIQSYTISNNIIGSSSTASSIINSTNGLTIGINSLTDCTNNTISNNLIANLSNTHTGAASQLIGISLPGGISGKFTVSGNTIRNLSNAGANLGTNASASIIGISLTAAITAGQTLSQNTIYELSNTNSEGVATGVIGIHYNGPTSGTNIIEKNKVYGISTSGTSASGFNYGINVSAGTSRFQNNMISVGSGNNGVNIRGINDIAGTNNYYHNTVYIGGTPTANAANTFAFNSAVTTNTRAFQNNIFVNTRSNNGSTGKHYAIALAGTTANPTGLTSNYNVFQATGTDGILGLFNAIDRTSLSAWQTATGQDANSINTSPVFVSTTDLHMNPQLNCVFNSNGVFIPTVTTDIDGATRSNPPDIGADEFLPLQTWTGSTNNLWSVGANWSCGVVPASTDAISISSGTPTLDVDFSVDLTGTLTINGTGALTVASGKTLTVAGTADFGGKSVVLKSDNSGTAAIGQITGTISGATNVKVERYLPAKRGWRLLTAPLKGSSSNTVASNWQGTANEGLLLFSPATYQTQTMTGYTTGGGSPNIWKFNSTSNQWQSIPNISSESLFTSTVNNGFLVFATGPSNSSNIASGSTATTLKPVGQLITGSVNYSLTANKYHLIGNPYASPLNTEVMVQAHANSKVYMMDPSLSTVGGYTVYDGTNWTPSTPSGSDKYIQSGQGFLLKSTSGGTFTIAETHKVSGNTNTWFVRTATDTSVDKIRVLLYKQNNNDWQLADGILAVNSSSGNHDVDAVDTDKMTNFNENILFKNGSSNLSIEYRGLPSAGTFQPMHVTGTTAQSYELRLKTENYSNSNFMPYLENTQTGVLTAIPTDGSELIVPFMGIAATSSTPDTRFRIVYQSALHLEETDSLEVLVYPNPINEGLFTVVLPQTNSSANYSLTNILGQEVQKGTLLALSNSIQVQQLTSGVYLLQVNQEGKRFTTKLMIN